ncbi:MAG: FAD-dependent oxidoreductase [Myxococcaceae bacterium]
MSLALGVAGFSFEDLYLPEGLARLHTRFLEQLKADDPALATRWQAYSSGGQWLQGSIEGASVKAESVQESELLIEVAHHVSAFVGKLFKIENELAALKKKLTGEFSLFEAKRDFTNKKPFNKNAPDRPKPEEMPDLDRRVQLLFSLGFPHAAADKERALSETIVTLMQMERMFSKVSPPPQASTPPADLAQRWTALRTALVSTDEGKQQFGSTLVGEDLAQVRGLLLLLDRWIYGRALNDHHFATQPTIRQPIKPLVFDKLVELKPVPELPGAIEGPDRHLRRRDGFKLTDKRYSAREVMNEIDYCIICHERKTDSCSKGFPEKDPAAAGHTYKKNPLGIPLTGCPLDERISEMHKLKSRGDSLGAVAMIAIDNPFMAGTGHRICNDCMKACVFQKQEPVNIPQIETSALTDVLALPWGFEIYGLMTRWNPLNLKRPHALPYNGKKVMVVGLGPAGYMLSHYLLNEGFFVASIDGLKLEPLPDDYVGANGKPMRPIKDFSELQIALDERVLAGFGGVSEYGITVRWDKTFLTLLHLTLARRQNLKLYGGVRFGGTITLEEAWKLGFDHVAIAAGAGKPTVVNMKNSLIRGVRAASDFLMALQLTGAAKKDSLANLQVQLPAIVIGGGLTGVDTATELFAYYPVQVEKVLDRHEKLVADIGEAAVFARMDAEETETLKTFLVHGKAVRAERERAKKAGEEPNFVPLVRSWGGVSLVYRRSLIESPAYKLNHEEVAKALEEGIRIIERMSPVEVIAGPYGSVSALKFERQATVDGKLKGTGEFHQLEAKTVCMAAGTSPNITYEREMPGSFALDEDGSYFRSYVLENGKLVETAPHEDLGKVSGFLTSYQRDGKYVSFFGDNHYTYAGNVVKAMASAKDGYPTIVNLFGSELKKSPQEDAEKFGASLDRAFVATVVAVNRLTPTIVEVVVHAPYAAQHFHPGQFYRLQNYERLAPLIDGTRLTMEGLALTGAWVDKEKGLLSTIVLEMGSSSRLCAMLQKGDPVVLMGPTGTPTEIPKNETVLLAGGGLGNAVLFSIGQALKAAGCKVIYFAGYRKKEDSYKMDEVEAGTDLVIWSVDSGETIKARRPQDKSFTGNIVQAMVAYAKGDLGGPPMIPLTSVSRLIAIGSDRMMNAVREARHGVLQPFLNPGHHAIGSINSPMQCMMKEICAQCLQRHVDPKTGKESYVFSCFNQDQDLDKVDFQNLNARLKANSVLEKQGNMWLDRVLKQKPGLLKI